MGKVNETIFGDMIKRSYKDEVRKEDSIDKAIELIIDMYTDSVVDGSYDMSLSEIKAFIKDNFNNIRITKLGVNLNNIISYVDVNWDDLSDRCEEMIDMKDEDDINECDGSAPNGGLVFGDISGMGEISFPGENGERGSGDLPLPSGRVYQQVAPFGSFVKIKKKKKKKFSKDKESCAKYDNPPIYSHVDDFRDYVERTYNKIDRK